MSLPTIVSVSPNSPAMRAGLSYGDQIASIDGLSPRDIIDFHQLIDGPDPELEIARGGATFSLTVTKTAGEPLGAEISDALFDRVRTCDNHCEFCFIYQLPKGLRKTLYVKDDDYRLSFLYGNFTTLTRFTEADFERVVTERLSPLYVSIHTTDPLLRSEMLRNSRGGISLRWLSAILAENIEVHGQIVLAPGVNDGIELVHTLTEIGLRFPTLATLGVVPLGVSKFSTEGRMRPMTSEEAEEAIDIVERFQESFLQLVGRPLVYASDEFYLLAEREFPPLELYGDLSQRENGVGIARSLEAEFFGERDSTRSAHAGFFASIDGAPALGYRAIRLRSKSNPSKQEPPESVMIVTSRYGRLSLERLLRRAGRSDIDFVEVPNDFFGGNIAVAGLMAGVDVARYLGEASLDSHRVLLPDVCLSEGRFIDGMAIEELPIPVEVVPTDGGSLAQALRGVRFPRLGG
ncbi:MAG: DUF512 domain-containing protein [Ferrimicrobium sp.]